MDGCWTHTGQERFGNMTRVRAPERHTVHLVIGPLMVESVVLMHGAGLLQGGGGCICGV